MTANSRPAARGGVFRLYVELWRHAAGRRGWLLGAFALLLASQLVKLSVPWLSGRALNALQLQGLPGLSDAGLWLLLVFGATALSWALHGPGRVLERNVALVVRQRVSGELLQRLLGLPLAWHEASHSAATAHRVEQSSRALFDFAQSQFIYLQNAVAIVGPIAALWLIEPWVGLTAILGFAGISLSISRFDRVMIQLAREENDAERRYASAMVDAIGNIMSVFALRQARGVLALMQRRLDAVYAPLRRMIVVNEGKWCAVDLASQALSCGLVALFAWLALRGGASASLVPASNGPSPTLPIGNVFMVWSYALQAGGVISAVAAHFQTFARQQADYSSADTIRDAPLSQHTQPAADQGWQQLRLAQLSFSHGSGRRTLDGLVFTLERGKRYALIGGSGSGKSTLLRILAGLYVAETIALQLDGGAIDADPYDAARRLRGSSTLIPQDAEVFEGSLAENLQLCESLHGAPTPPDYAPALTTACADFVDASEAGLAQSVAERGANWSGGQRQRIALARGVLAAQGSPLILLDEPTAALDPATERRVYANVFARFPEACIVSSVHRLNLLDRFDCVLLMASGKLLDSGSLGELAARSPEFAALLAAQNKSG